MYKKKETAMCIEIVLNAYQRRLIWDNRKNAVTKLEARLLHKTMLLGRTVRGQ